MKRIRIKLSVFGMHKIVKKKGHKRDEQFIENLWNYVMYSKEISRTFVSCPFCNKNHSFHKIYNYLDSEECKLVYTYKDAIVKVGNSVMYIVSENGEKVYEVPDLYFHFFAEHNMLPRDYFRRAVMYGAKPGTTQYFESVRKFLLDSANIKCVSEKELNSREVECNVCKKKGQWRVAYRMNTLYCNELDSYVSYPINEEVKYKYYCCECGHYI